MPMSSKAQVLAPSYQYPSRLLGRRSGARTWGHKGTVRRWTKSGLPSITDQKPLLILGEDLIEFLTLRKAPSQKCSPFECYCVKCRALKWPRAAGPFLAAAKLEVGLLVALYQAAKDSVCC